MCSINNVLLICVLMCYAATALCEDNNEASMDNSFTFDLTEGLPFIHFNTN